MAVVAAISPRRVQSHHHLVPPSTFAQVLWEACQVAFGQPLQLSHHLLSILHRVKTMDPKHNLDLDLEGQHAAKRLVLGIDQPSAVHLDTTSSWQLTTVLDLPLLILWCPPITHSRQDLWSPTKKCTHGGYPLESLLVIHDPHVMSLHQSRSLKESVKPHAP